jgi:hypothetical protein
MDDLKIILASNGIYLTDESLKDFIQANNPGWKEGDKFSSAEIKRLVDIAIENKNQNAIAPTTPNKLSDNSQKKGKVTKAPKTGLTNGQKMPVTQINASIADSANVFGAGISSEIGGIIEEVGNVADQIENAAVEAVASRFEQIPGNIVKGVKNRALAYADNTEEFRTATRESISTAFSSILNR